MWLFVPQLLTSFLVLTFLSVFLVDGVKTEPVKRSNFGQTKSEFQWFHHWIPFRNWPRDGPRGFSLSTLVKGHLRQPTTTAWDSRLHAEMGTTSQLWRNWDWPYVHPSITIHNMCVPLSPRMFSWLPHLMGDDHTPWQFTAATDEL